MCIRRETREKARQNLAFSRVSKPRTHITHMLRILHSNHHDEDIQLNLSYQSHLRQDLFFMFI
jgi:hypothetical protein